MRPGLVSNGGRVCRTSNGGRVCRTLKESWDSVNSVVKKVTQIVADAPPQKPLIDRGSDAKADTLLLSKSSENSFDNFKDDKSNFKSISAVGSLLGRSDDSINRLESITGEDKSCGDDNNQCNSHLGVPETEMQSVSEKCSAGVSEAEYNYKTMKAEEATKTYLLSDIMSKYHRDDKKIPGTLGKSSLLALMERTAGNKNEQLKKDVQKERKSTGWEALLDPSKGSQGTEVPESDNLLSLKHDIVRKRTVAKHNDGTVESEGDNVTLVGEKSNRSNETSTAKSASSLAESCPSSPLNSGSHITMNPFAKKIVAGQSADCLNGDNLGFNEALKKSLNTSVGVRQDGIMGLIDCIRHLLLDQVRDNSKLSKIPQRKLAGGKGSRKLIKSFNESESDNESQTLRTTLMKINGARKGESCPQMEVNRAAEARSITSKPGKDGRPDHKGNIQYLSISSPFRRGKKYPDNLIIKFWRTNKDYNLIITALAKHGPISLRPLFRGRKFEDICVQLMEKAELPAAAMAIDRVIQSHCITAYLESNFAEGTAGRVSIPENAADPDFPSTLLENPAKTIKIMELTEGVTLQQLKEALDFGTNSLTNVLLGSSNSFAYAEFKTLESVEKAIAKHSISLAGKQPHVLRVDVPRTTVVRISNFSNDKDRRLLFVCSEYGAVRRVLRRSRDMVDVHFEVTELPNMLRIVNSLNGMEALGTKISAAPAPVFPPEVVEILWSQPDGRQYLMSVIVGLVEKISDIIMVNELKQKMTQQLLS